MNFKSFNKMKWIVFNNDNLSNMFNDQNVTDVWYHVDSAIVVIFMDEFLNIKA